MREVLLTVKQTCALLKINNYMLLKMTRCGFLDRVKIDKDSTIKEIIDDKMSNKEDVKKLYSNINEYLFGKYSKTLSTPGSLFKESFISDSKQNLILAEKMARLYKRTEQLKESVDLYGAMGEFGQDLKEFNETMEKIMESIKK